MASTKVLLVEDEFLIRTMLSEAMAEEGFDVVEAASGDEALQMATEQEGFDLLLTDVQLPGSLDGVALAHAVRARSPELRVIYTTGRPDAVDCGAGRPREVMIAKPYLPSDVCAAARRLVAV